MNLEHGRLVKDNSVIEYAPDNIRIDDTIYAAPTDEQYLQKGWKKLIGMNYPETSAGDNKHWEEDSFSQTETQIEKIWIAVDDPVIYRKFSKLKIYGTVAQLGKWDVFTTWLNSKTIEGLNGWTAFQLAQELSENHPLFTSLAEEARTILDLTVEQFEECLAKCELEA